MVAGLSVDLRLPPDDGRPLYRRMIEKMRHCIETGEFQPGDLIPPEVEIARRNRLSRHTVRQAIAELVHEGLLRRERGRGTFVLAKRIAPSLVSYYAFRHDSAELDPPCQTQILHQRMAEAGHIAAVRLAIEVGAPIVETELLRVADGQPLSLDFSVVAHERAPAAIEADFSVRFPFDAMLARDGYKLSFDREELRPVILDGRQARLLGATPGSPAFHVERIVQASRPDGAAHAIEWRRSLVRGDRFLYRVTTSPLPR